MSRAPNWSSEPLVRICIHHAPKTVTELLEGEGLKLPGPNHVDMVQRQMGHYVAFYSPANAEKIEAWLSSYPNLEREVIS